MNPTTALQIIPKAMAYDVKIAWDFLLLILRDNWQSLLLLLFLVFFISIIKAMLGRWGTLGSLLYHFFYFGILFIIGLIWGPQVFIDDAFNLACAVILYPACYLLVGTILNKTGFLSTK